MTSSVSTTSTDYDAAMASIRADVEAYCIENGLDPDTYLNNLDGNATATVLDNPTLNAYYQLCFVGLAEVLYPDITASLNGDIGEPINYNDVISGMDDEMISLLDDLINDDPELMAVYTRQAGGESEEQALLGLLDEVYDSSDSVGIGADLFAEAYAYNTANGLGLEGAVAKEEEQYAILGQLTDKLTDVDQAINDIIVAFNNDEMDEYTFQAQMESFTFTRESIFAMIQQVNDSYANFFQMLSEMLNKMYGSLEVIGRNTNV